jgi:hypothetical protein
MDEVLLILGGVALSLGLIAFARRLGPRRELRLYGIALVPTAAEYLVYAVINGVWSAMPVELLGTVLFGGLGLVGVWRAPSLIAVGWAGHVAWDLAVEKASAAIYAPWWLPLLCVGTDIFLAGYIAALVWPRKA